MPQVFAVEGFAAGFERGGNDQAVAEAGSLLDLQAETASIKRADRMDPPKRDQGVVQSLASFLRSGIEFSGYDVKGLLDNLITDATGFVPQDLLNRAFCPLAFVVIGFIEQVNKDIGVEEVFNAPSFRPE